MGINYTTYVFDNIFFILILRSIYFLGVFWTFNQFKKIQCVITSIIQKIFYFGVSTLSTVFQSSKSTTEKLLEKNKKEMID